MNLATEFVMGIWPPSLSSTNPGRAAWVSGAFIVGLVCDRPRPSCESSGHSVPPPRVYAVADPLDRLSPTSDRWGPCTHTRVCRNAFCPRTCCGDTLRYSRCNPLDDSPHVAPTPHTHSIQSTFATPDSLD